MTISSKPTNKRSPRPWVFDILLIYVLLAGAFFRASGLFWGENQYLHPDERFLVWVGTDISPVNSISEYFDTENSSLNPHNRGHGFYVYGTLPMFLTRYVVEWVYGHSGFPEMTQVGRSLSTLADLLTVLLVYLVTARLYDKRVAILATAFSAAAVLQIQQSHFFTMDTFINFFSFLAFYFAVRVMKEWKLENGDKEIEDSGSYVSSSTIRFSHFVRDPLFFLSLAFGVALGMAVASKLNAAPMAIVLPAAMVIRLVGLPPEKRQKYGIQAFGYLILAALISLLVFRILQPYAFSGPGFFGITPNPKWMANIRELRAQSTGDVDFPPAMQWARRPPWFSLQNLTLWGLGLPLGVLAWVGFLWVGWRMWIKGEWQRHALIWGWTALYFTWQSMVLNPTMRYQLPIYPTLAIFAAWAVVRLYDYGRKAIDNRRTTLDETPLATRPRPQPVNENVSQTGRPSGIRWLRVAAVLIGCIVLLATYVYAFGFSRIYARPITRIAATRWIYQNIPGPITLPIRSPEGIYNQPIPFPYSQTITPGAPYSANFQPKVAGSLSEVLLPRVKDEQTTHDVRSLVLTISAIPGDGTPLATATLNDNLTPVQDPRGKSYTLTLDQPVLLDPDKSYNLQLEVLGQVEALVFDSEITLRIHAGFGDPIRDPIQQTLIPPGTIVRSNAPLTINFAPSVDGNLAQIYLGDLTNQEGETIPDALKVSLVVPEDTLEPLRSDATIQADPSGQGYVLILDQPLPVFENINHMLTLEMVPSGGVISLSGMGIASEGDWDDGLPLRMDGYDGYGGIYPLDLNFNMYWDDNPDKLARFTRILDQADYITISSSRQWGSLPRLPERFPMTTVYYRNLMGCPAEITIEWCYSVADPVTFLGDLGYELVKTFVSEPGVGPLRINDQFAEEAFTVYDHPKVLIFRKTENYNSQQVQAILEAVDFSHVVRVPPMQAKSYPANLLLPPGRLAEQRLGGTWSALFNTDALQNRSQVLSVVIWYLSVGLLGLITYPLLRLALPGLNDRGYPLARTAGLLILSYLVWLAGSFRIPFTRLTISAALAVMTLVAAFLTYRGRRTLRQELRRRGTYFLMIEGLTLLFFLVDLIIRWGNPDLWHPWKGGEKPMDFSYFNAVLKSTSFPPYDPWYAGGYLNYYYYGFVLVAVLVKWLGIVPSVAYNLILPTIFSLMAMGAFSLVWNLIRKDGSGKIEAEGDRQIVENERSYPQPRSLSFIPAISAAIGMAVLGNLGTVRMIFQGYQKLVAPDGVIEGAGLLTRWIWAIRGFVMTLNGAHLPYSLGDWYWIPSRAIPALGDVEPITEFPFFTVLYADLHAHLFALPLTLLALAFPISIVLGRGRFNGLLGGVAGFLLGGMAIGALRPTNTWDFYPYLALGIIAVGYALWCYFRLPEKARQALPYLANLPAIVHRMVPALGGMLLLAGLAFLLFQPYAQWYALGYGKIDLWKGTHTPFSAYLTHWGLFLFVIISWMIWETRDWMAKTPLSAVRRLKPYLGLLQAVLLLLLLGIVGLLWLKVRIAWFVVPLAAWAGVLILRPGQSDAKRIVLFIVGTGLTLTLMVEVIVLVGDIGRMNTVFKFYLQVWTLFAISAGAALGWSLLSLPRWSLGWRNAWQIALMALMAGAALYPLLGGTAKIKDRMAPEAPRSLDGMTYMQYATYSDEWGPMDLNQDYRAIRWMQENVVNSPVIVEANLRALYRWGSRYSVYTGLPGVVGWEWHQQQQRAVVPSNWVSERIAEVDDFYLTTELTSAQNFLRKYDVRYIIIGQQERGHYPGPGLDKFVAAEGNLWREVYHDGDTIIYEVIVED